MNNELIERIDRMLCCYPTKTINKVLQDCKAALTQQQEAEPVDNTAWTLPKMPLPELRAIVSKDGHGNDMDGPAYSSRNMIEYAKAVRACITPKPAAQPQVPEDLQEWIQFQPDGSIIAYSTIESRWVILRFAAKEEGK